MLEGLRSAAGGADIASLDAAIGALQKRQFMLVSAKDSRPRVFGTRWAMSYLRGPLTKEQVQQLMSQAPRPVAPAPAADGCSGGTARRRRDVRRARGRPRRHRLLPRPGCTLGGAGRCHGGRDAPAGVPRHACRAPLRRHRRRDRRAAGVRGALRPARRRARPRRRDGRRLRRPRLPARRARRRRLRAAVGARRRGEVLRPGRRRTCRRGSSPTRRSRSSGTGS